MIANINCILKRITKKYRGIILIKSVNQIWWEYSPAKILAEFCPPLGIYPPLEAAVAHSTPRGGRGSVYKKKRDLLSRYPGNDFFSQVKLASTLSKKMITIMHKIFRKLYPCQYLNFVSANLIYMSMSHMTYEIWNDIWLFKKFRSR